MKNGNERSGIWFYIQLSNGWALRCFSEDPSVWPDGPSHPECWPEIAEELAESWAEKRGSAAEVLKEGIIDAPYGFPRGRISWSERKVQTCFYGEEGLIDRDVRTAVEEFFAGGKSIEWKQDAHEHCLAFDRDEVCWALGVEGDWEAV